MFVIAHNDKCVTMDKNDAIHKAGPVYSPFQYTEHKAGLVLCILNLAPF